MFLKYTIILCFVFSVLDSSSFQRNTELQSITIYGICGQNSLREEIDKHSIRSKSTFKLMYFSEWLPDGTNSLEIYEYLDTSKVTRTEKQLEAIRFLVRFKLKNSKNMKVYINKFNEYQLNDSKEIRTMDDKMLQSILSLTTCN